MELIKTKGLVLRSVNMGDYDKMLTVLTEGMGKISVVAKGAKSLKHGGNASTNVFCYSDFVLYEKKELYVVSQASGLESFFGLANDLDALNCGANLVDFADFISQDAEEAKEVLRITLNVLYALANLHKSPLQVSVAFYLKLLNILGFEPELQCCAACGNEEGLSFFSCSCGGMVCHECAPEIPDKKKLQQEGFQIMQYIRDCDIKQLLKFEAPEPMLRQLYDLIVTFVSEHLDYKPKHMI